ncbi:uncharacterized protein LOC112570685 [Pomacea canaliculata]|uniref:uncharacterized protein LOC112570685 n=1 Tax=Pomacea canaliculata TaxID=400727 RepID=UPI000D731CAA|nr:uncharacterized protein LOC112570685 [Pomacea canaliculata]
MRSQIALLLVTLAGLKAEDGLAPLVVSSCIAGILFFVIVLGSSFVCFISWRKRSKKVSQTTSNPRVSSFVNTDSPPPQAKAYTHHALLVRQRPPLQFYTVRSDPRDQGLAAGAVPMGPFRRPTSMGRPVLYLDMLDPAMNENNAMPHYANAAYGGMNISEMQSVDERGSTKDNYRRKHGKSKRRSRSRSRARSESESRDRSRSSDDRRPQMNQRLRPYPEEEIPVLAMPGDIILTDIRSSRRESPARPLPAEPKREQAFPRTSGIATVLQERTLTMTDRESESDASSLSGEARGGVDTVHADNVNLHGYTQDFQKSDSQLSQAEDNSTPDPDYLLDFNVSPAEKSTVSQQRVTARDSVEVVPHDFAETIPRGHFSAGPGDDNLAGRRRDTDPNDKSPNNGLSRHQPVTPVDSQDINDILKSLDQAFTPGVSSPPYSEAAQSTRPVPVRQLSPEEYRPPTPPPDMDSSDDSDTDERFSKLLVTTRPPTPPRDSASGKQEEKSRLLSGMQTMDGLRLLIHSIRPLSPPPES